MAGLTVVERERRAWSEYLAWEAGSAPTQYVQTEALAWRRLQDELLAIRTGVRSTFSTELAEIAFTPDVGVDVAFEACPDSLP